MLSVLAIIIICAVIAIAHFEELRDLLSELRNKIAERRRKYIQKAGDNATQIQVGGKDGEVPNNYADLLTAYKFLRDENLELKKTISSQGEEYIKLLHQNGKMRKILAANNLPQPI